MTDGEWKGLKRVSGDYPPFIVERIPYEECKNCNEFQFRPVYDGRVGEGEWKCKNCHYSEADDSIDPDIFVHDANKSLVDFVMVLFGILAFVLITMFASYTVISIL